MQRVILKKTMASFPCRVCFMRVDDIMETEYEQQDNMDANYHLKHKLKNVPIQTEEHGFGEPDVPSVDVSIEGLSSELRIRYVMGVQLLIQSQCQVPVDKFGASPLICGLAGVIWMRFVAASRVFDEEWADADQYQGFSEERMSHSQPSKGTYNMYGQSANIRRTCKLI